MHLRCPHCRQPIELVSDDSFKEVTCPTCGSSFSLISGDSTATFVHTKDKTIGHFQLLQQVGAGQFGVVWKARDTALDRVVALKIPRRDQLSSAEQEYFFRDARAAAQLDHPGIVNVHEVGRDGDTIFIASQFIDGANLGEWLKVHRPTARESAQLMIAIAEAVHQAHARGVIHRDLKPGNILMDLDGVPHVADFGLAKRESGEITMTVDGQILGTPAYMSPEQARGKAHEADARSDVYSLGVILYELLTGELPFRGERQMLLMQIQRDEPLPPRRLNARIPRNVETICLKAMAKEPARRYPSAGALAADLKRFLAGQPILARPAGAIERAWRWSKRKPLAAGLLSLLVLLVTVLAVGSGLIASAYRREATLATANENLATKEQAGRRRAEFLVARQMFEHGWTKHQLGNAPHGLLLIARSLIEFEALKPDGAPGEGPIIPEATAWAQSARQHLLHGLMAHNCPRATFVHELGVKAVAFSPDGTKLATASVDDTAHLWDVTTGKQLGEPLQHEDTVNSIAFSPDGTKLATGSTDKTARLWDVTTRKQLGEPLQHEDYVNSIAFSPDGTKLATGSTDKTARLWDVTTRKQLGEPLLHESGVFVVAFSPDGAELATASDDGSVRLWDVTTRKQLGKLLSGVTAVAFSPDGTKLATGSRDKTARLWDVTTGKQLGEPLQHENFVFGVAFSPDGTKLATGSFDKTARLWDVTTGKQLGEPLLHEIMVFGVAFSPDGTKLATASYDKIARLWDVTTTGKQFGERLSHEDHVADVAFSPDGTKLATASYDKTARLWDVTTGKQLGEPLSHQGPVTLVTFSLDGTKLATGSTDKTARLWDVTTRKQLGEPLQHQGEIRAVAFGPDGLTLATDAGDAVRLWDVATGKPVGEPLQHDDYVNSVAFSLDGTKLSTASADGSVRMWDVTTGKQLGEPLSNQGSVTLVTFSPDATKLATISLDTTAQLWDATTGKELGEPLSNQSPVGHVTFSPDGTKLATGSRTSAQLWDETTRKQLGEPLQHDDYVTSAAFSADGTKLATGSHDRTARLWDVPAPLTEPAEHLLLWAETIFAAELDEAGRFSIIDADQLGNKLARLAKAGGPPRAWLEALNRRRAQPAPALGAKP